MINAYPDAVPGAARLSFQGGAASQSSSSDSGSGDTNNYYTADNGGVVNVGNTGTTSTTTSSGSSGSTGDDSSALDGFKEWVGTLFDWVEVRLERLTDKISNYVQRAENYLNSRNYNAAASDYRSALSNTITQISTEEKAYTKYMNEVDKVLRKATEAELISANGCEVLKKQMAKGQIQIEEYSEAMQEVISATQTWFDKATDASNAIQQLNADIISYTQSLKSLRDTQRDSKISTYEDYVAAGTSGYTSTSGSYYKHYRSQLKMQNKSLKYENKAYNAETKKLNNDASKARKKSGKAVKKAYKNSSGKYKKALKSAYKAVYKGQAVSNSDMKTIAANSGTIYGYLLVYNETLNNAQVSREEQALVYATNNTELYSNTAEKYNKYDEVSQNNIDLNEARAGNATSASSANKYLDTAAAQYKTIIKNDQKEIDAYDAQVKSDQKKIAKNKGTTSALNKQSKSKQKEVQKLVNKCKKHAENGTAISANELSKLYQYYTEGLVTYKFYTSCQDYNNALESKREAEAQEAIDEETKKQYFRETGQTEFENVQQEYQNKTNQNQSKTSNIEAQQAYQTTRGIIMNEQNYRDLISQSQKDVQIYNDEIKALNDQVQHNLDSGYWTTADQEYIDAMLAIEELETEIINCETNQEEWNNAIINLPFEEVERMIEELTKLQSLYESVANLMTAQGQDLTLTQYTDQIDTMYKQMEQWQIDLAEAEKNLALADADPEGVYGGKTVQAWTEEVYEYKTEINNCEISIENMKDSLRDDIIWRQFDRAHLRAQELADVLSEISGLLDQDMWFTYEGQITQYGVAELATLTKQIDAAQTDVQNYMNDIDTLQKLYEKDLAGIDITDDLTELAKLSDEYYDLLEYGFYSEEEYTEKLAELEQELLDAANSVQDLTSDVINMFETAANYELQAVFDVIQAEQDALQAKKDYYDYDKTIKNSNANIESLRSQIDALNGVETAEARAEKARLEAQLAEAEEDLQDTVYEHSIELSQDALDALRDDLQDAFDQYFQDLNSNLDEITNLMEISNNLTEANGDKILGTLESLLDYYGISTTYSSSILTGAGYASGTHSAKRSSIATVAEKGPELVVRKATGDVLMPINQGDAVIPTDFTENLFKWGSMDPTSVLSNTDMHDVPTVNKNVQITQNYDSLLHVDGNVDKTVVADMEEFTKDIYEGAYNYAIKNIARDAKKVGIKVGH